MPLLTLSQPSRLTVSTAALSTAALSTAALSAAAFLASVSAFLPDSAPPAVQPAVTEVSAGAGDPAEPRAGPNDVAAGRFHWPLAPPHPVLRPFEAPATPYGPGHRGVDLGGRPGEPVLAAANGVVVFAGQLADRGVVSVDHPNGLRTTYEPVSPTVKPGQRVASGAVLGRLQPGHPGCSSAPACLHWGVRRGDEYLDPLALMSTGQVRLLPWKEAA